MCYKFISIWIVLSLVSWLHLLSSWDTFSGFLRIILRLIFEISGVLVKSSSHHFLMVASCSGKQFGICLKWFCSCFTLNFISIDWLFRVNYRCASFYFLSLLLIILKLSKQITVLFIVSNLLLDISVIQGWISNLSFIRFLS